MAVITTGSLPKLNWPGLKTLFGIAYNKHPKVYTSLFETVDSDKAWEEYQQVTGFPIGQLKPQGQSVSYAGQYQSYTTRLVNATYALGFIVTMEERQDNLYDKVSKGRTVSLAFSMEQAREVNAHLIYNRAFTSGYTGGDGVTLASTAHPLQAGGTYANRPVAGSPLSEASIEDAIITIMGFVDDNSLLINVKPKTLVVPRQETFNAIRITKSMYQPGTANNDINAIMESNALPGGTVTSVYLTSAHAWFLRTDAGGDGHGMIFQERMAPEFMEDNDFDTKNEKAATVERYSMGWDDARGLWCNPGP
jgi:hypothetical protein